MIRNEALIRKTAEEFESIAVELGLECRPQIFEWVTPEQILALLPRGGARQKYPHWSFGKTYQILKRTPSIFHELVINSNPVIAYLVSNTVFPVQAVVLAHVYGHNDFFKNNRCHKSGNADYVVALRDSRTRRILELEDDPAVGVANVEKVLDAARALAYHRIGPEPSSPSFLEFMLEKAPSLEPWERELIRVVDDEAREELAMLQTKVMNEGWAAYWEKEILMRSRTLETAVKDDALAFHAQLVSPPSEPTLGYNPYNIGMLLWRQIRKNFGLEAMLRIRRDYSDKDFIEEFLTRDVGAEANLAWFVLAEKGEISFGVSAQQADEETWEKIKASVVSNLPIMQIPRIQVGGVADNGTLMLVHYNDGRDLDVNEAMQVLARVASALWKDEVVLVTSEMNEEKEEPFIIRAYASGQVDEPVPG